MTRDWFSAAPAAFQGVAVPIFAILVTCLLVFGAMAIYRMVTGKSISEKDDD